MAARRSRSPGRRSPLPTPPSTPPRSASRSGPNARSSSPSKSRGVAVAKLPLAAAAAAARTQLVLQLAVFLDLLGVMLVVPNLIHRFKELGISTANYGLVSSVYSASQIVGGLLIGYLGDNVLGRKRVLLLSFAGAGLSYLLVGVADSLGLLVLSRVVVGLVKQTMTTSTALVTQLSDGAGRTAALAKLGSATTLASVVGTSIGGYLSSRFGRRAPCFLAAALFLLDFALVKLLLPDSPPAPPASPPAPPAPPATVPATTASCESTPKAETSTAAPSPTPKAVKPKAPLRLGGFRAAFQGAAGRLLALRLMYGFLVRSAYSLHALYELERWQLTPERTGYLSSYKTLLGLAIERFAVGSLAQRYSEARLLQASVGLAALNSLLEWSHSSFRMYTLLNLPTATALTRTLSLTLALPRYTLLNLPTATALAVLTRTCLSSIFSTAVPVADSGTALSVLDVCQSAVGVVAPLYGGLLASRLGVQAQPAVAAAHYVLLLGLTAAVLARNARQGAPPAPTRHRYELAEVEPRHGLLVAPPGHRRPKPSPRSSPRSSPKPRKRKAA